MTARKPNYSFERHERERLKAEKKAKRIAKKKEARSKTSAHPDVPTKWKPRNNINDIRVMAQRRYRLRTKPFGLLARFLENLISTAIEAHGIA